MSRSIAGLKPEVQAALARHRELLDALGIKTIVTFTTRTDAEQWALWCQGRRTLEEVNDARLAAGMLAIGKGENARTVTNCDGKKTRSKHQDGLAYDLAILNAKGNIDWKAAPEFILAMGKAGESAGMEWGGRWKPLDKTGIGWDAWHFQRKGA